MGTLGRAIYTVGFWIRKTCQALDRLGCRLQGSYYFQEQLSRHRTLMNLFDKAPLVDKEAFVAPSASVIGDVQIGRSFPIWYGCVLRVYADLWISRHHKHSSDVPQQGMHPHQAILNNNTQEEKLP